MTNAQSAFLQQMDNVLDYFKTPFEFGGLTFDNVVNHFDPDHNQAFGHYLVAILEKLERDKYIFIHPNKTYHISLEGRLFEGYAKQEENKAIQLAYQKAYIQRMEHYEMSSVESQKSQEILTLILALGTIALALVAALQLYLEYLS